jgi:hypothetical protein
MVEGSCGAVRVAQVDFSVEGERVILRSHRPLSHGNTISRCHIGNIANVTMILPTSDVILAILPI